MEPLLTGPEVASLLRISKSQAYALMRKGVIPAVRLGTSVRVRQSDLQKFLENLISEDWSPELAGY